MQKDGFVAGNAELQMQTLLLVRITPSLGHWLLQKFLSSRTSRSIIAVVP